MSKSKLATLTVPAYEGNYSKGRYGRKIEMITIHHMAGKLTASQCGGIFQQVGRCGSSHYGIGYEGEIANYVDENDTAWTNSNWDANCKAVTIETSNDVVGGNWHVSDKSLRSLIKLVADISKRNNLGTLIKGKNVTWHSMYSATACPGSYLLSKMDYIVAEANKINNPVKPTPTPTPAPTYKYKVGDVVTINGVYVSSVSTDKLAPARTSGKITKIVQGANNPYLLDNGNLGWVNDNCIVGKKVIDNSIKVGDIVKVKYGARSYEGVAMASHVYNNKYRVDELNGKRAVLDVTGLCTAFNVDDLIKQ